MPYQKTLKPCSCAGLQERIVHEQLAAGRGGWRGANGYYMPAPADRMARTLATCKNSTLSL